MATEHEIKAAIERGFKSAWPHSFPSQRLIHHIAGEVMRVTGVAPDDTQGNLFTPPGIKPETFKELQRAEKKFYGTLRDLVKFFRKAKP